MLNGFGGCGKRKAAEIGMVASVNSWQGALQSMSPTVNIPKDRPSGVALFDLDGTLIAWDCQLLFRHYVVRREPWRGLFLPIFLAFIPLVGLLGAGPMKRVFLSYLWKMPKADLEEYSRDFAKWLIPAIYGEMRAKMEAKRAEGCYLILSSASPEFYVREIGRELGFDLTLGTPVEMGYLFPDLDNHKGEAKVDRLRQVLPPAWFDDGKLVNCHGYTDSCADLPMLRICDDATVVNPKKELLDIAKKKGWEVVLPSRPWSHRLGFAWRTIALLIGFGKDPGGIR